MSRLRIHLVLVLPSLPWVLSCSAGSDAPAVHGPQVGRDAGGSEAAPDSSPGSSVDSGSSTAASDGDPADGGPNEADSDAGVDDGMDACGGSVAVVGGAVAGASTIAFAATRGRAGSWAVSSLPSNVASPPALVAFGGGFVAAFVDAEGALEFTTFTWSWGSPAAVAGRTATGAPSLAAVGTSLHLIYQGVDSKYRHGTYTEGPGWDTADDPVGSASAQGFGPSAPAATSIASTLVIAYGGQNGSLYDETWDGGWQPDSRHSAAAVGTLPPAIVALRAGASDSLIVYPDAGGTLHSTARAVNGGTWSAPALVDNSAFTDASVSLVALAGGRAMMVYEGTNELAYFSIYDPSANPIWTTPAAVGNNSAKMASPPSVAAGVCGDDAVAVLVQAAGVAVIRYAGGQWLQPTVLGGTAGMTFASVASQP